MLYPLHLNFAVVKGKMSRIYNRTLYFDSLGDGGTYSIRGSKAVDDGQWHHVVFVYNGTTAKLYVNCALDKEAAIILEVWVKTPKYL